MPVPNKCIIFTLTVGTLIERTLEKYSRRPLSYSSFFHAHNTVTYVILATIIRDWRLFIR